jgi:hypothetical protein
MSTHDTGGTDRYQYRVEPVFGEQAEAPLDPEVEAALQEFFAAQGITSHPSQPTLVGWLLQLRVDGVEVERRTFAGDEAGYQDANAAGGVWMAQHGADSLSQWLMHALQGMQRMDWDEGYRREIAKRIS